MNKYRGNTHNEKFNEATRVQMPALVHLTRLGYEYFGKIVPSEGGTTFDPDTNILIKVFKDQFEKLNPSLKNKSEEVLQQIKRDLNNDDLGRSFYKLLIGVSPYRLIDYDNPSNNTFHFTAEFTYKNGQDEFRPDITLFVNGLPLVFIEVKRPNNRDGLIAESERMNNARFPNKKFRRFINITQFMIFSNNMEYDALGGIVPIQGAFYCTTSRSKSQFSTFREENPASVPIAPFIENYPYKEIDNLIEKRILNDYNCQVIHNSSEYKTNIGVNTPTNRIITSLCSPERLLYLLNYSIAYVHLEKEVNGKIEQIDQKHIMRYPQLFASLAIKEKLDKGITSGVIWHTQGSGKTALAFYLNRILTDYFSKKNQVAKFYFVVDRLDLLEQASQEFEARGLEVKTVNSRDELMKQFKTQQSLEGYTGNSEITVVNIQKFATDTERVNLSEYSTNLQRVFIIDEAHRGYNPKGCFLANLFEADPNSIKIALTGTPLLKEERSSWRVFGDYFHTYYYDKSIQDGYTLKIIREDIETSYREKLTEVYDNLDDLVQKKDVRKSDIIEHESYVKELLHYIISDFNKFRQLRNDNTLGGMVICETSEQARRIVSYFDEIQEEINRNSSNKSNLKVGLILFDSDDKETRKQIIKDFKINFKIDILVVFNMLLTGFDAPRLKRIYLGRKLKDHSLLQALTRVNRPYKKNRYGYIVDFADIKQNFDETNEAYLNELNRFNDPEETGEGYVIDTFAQVLENPEKLIEGMRDARQALFDYTIDNAEVFSSEIAKIDDKEKVLELKKALLRIRDSINIVRAFGDEELKNTFKKLEIEKLPFLLGEVERQIESINRKELFARSDEMSIMINKAMANIEFNFKLVGKEEMKLLSGYKEELKNKWEKVINGFADNLDPADPDYITLRDAFALRFKERGFVIENVNDFEEISEYLDDILEKLVKLKRKNEVLMRRYNDDKKYVRTHKRISEENQKRADKKQKPIISNYDEEIVKALSVFKSNIDQKVYDRNDILKKDIYFERTVMEEISSGFKYLDLKSERDDRLFIQERISREYLDQYNETYSYVY